MRNQPSTGPNPTVTVRLTKKNIAQSKNGLFPNILPQKKYQHFVPNMICFMICCQLQLFPFLSLDLNRPKPHRLRQPHQKKEHSPVKKNWTLSQHLATKKIPAFCSKHDLFHDLLPAATVSSFEFGPVRNQPSTGPNKYKKNIMPNVSVSTWWHLDGK